MTSSNAMNSMLTANLWKQAQVISTQLAGAVRALGPIVATVKTKLGVFVQRAERRCAQAAATGMLVDPATWEIAPWQR